MEEADIEREWRPDAVHRRLPVEFPVVLEGLDGAAGPLRLVGSVVHVSPTGLFVASRTPIPAGARLCVSLVLPLAAGPRRLVAAGNVRWVNDPSAPRAPELPPGMGIEFASLEPGARADLESLLHELREPAAAAAGRAGL